MPTVRSASSASDPNSRSTLQVGSLPTGWQPGDIVLIVFCNGADETSYNNTGSLATGWTWISSTGVQNNGGAAFTSNIAYKIMKSGDVWPGDTLGNGLGWSTSARYSEVAVAIQPDTGQTFTTADILNIAGSPTVGSTAATSFTPPSYAAGTNTGLSVILNSARAFNNSATAISTTAPTNWTEPTNGDTSTASGTNASSRQVSTSVSARASQTGTISPGSETISQAGATVTANVYQLFINGSGGGGGASFMPASPFVVNQAINRAAYY